MRTLHAIPVVAIALAAACKFPASDALDAAVNEPEPDAVVVADAFVQDASASGCLTAPTVECAGPVLRTCSTVGQPPVDTACGWGCSSVGSPHCAKLQPAGGAVTATDLDDPTNQLKDITINTLATSTINSENGSINGNVRSAGGGVKNGIEYIARNNVGILRVKSLTIEGGLSINVVGTIPLAIVATNGITIKVRINAQGGCSGNNAGPGGFAGGGSQTDGSGNMGKGLHGSGIHDDASGGGGAGFGKTGGDGGDSKTQGGGNDGDSYGMATVMTLVGGAGGGGGGGTAGGVGGGGGGAIQIVANGKLRFEGATLVTAGVNAGGCGGKGGTDAGGGGGAGGTILLEAPVIELDRAGLTVNGGGGGGANGTSPGQPGQFSQSRADGGVGGQNEGNGGRGGARMNLDGSDGTNDMKNAGGGGGAVGWIRFNTYSGFISLDNAFLSPTLSDSNTTTTQATANVQ